MNTFIRRLSAFVPTAFFLLFFLSPAHAANGVSVERGQSPLTDLDALRYIASQPDLIDAFGADAAKGRSHYETWGIKEGRKITFEPLYYTASHPDLIEAFGVDETKAVTHYIQWGYKEKRAVTFTPLQALRYTASHPDLIEAFGADATKGVRHYVQWGYREKRVISFEPSRYMASHPDLIEAFGGDELKAATHYIQWGYREKRQTTFSDLTALQYIASFGDLIVAFGTDVMAAIRHYVTAGYREGRRIIFDALGYLARHPDLQQAFGSDTLAATQHYINWGFREGRDYSRLALSGTVTGLAPGVAVTLRTGSSTLRRSSNGAFDFGKVLLFGKEFVVEVAESPTGQTCSVSNASGTATSDVGNVRVSCEYNAPFASEARTLPDLEPFYQATCGASGIGRSLQHVIPSDLDRDGRVELLLTIWCSPVTSSADFSGPTPSRLYVFRQDAVGNFTERTSDFFATTPVDLGGVGEYYVADDFNKDGYTDFIYAMNREDGRRINDPPLTQRVYSVALMSLGAGRYEAVQWGNLAWHGQMMLVDNARGGKDVVETAFTGGPQGWSWDGRWLSVPGYDWVGTGGALFFSRGAPGEASQKAVSSLLDSKRVGVEARVRSGDQWNSVGDFSYAAFTGQKICCGHTSPVPATMTRIDEKDYIDPSFGFFCELKRTPTSEPEAIINFNAQEIIGGYKGQVIVYFETPLRGTDKLFSFSVTAGNTLRRNELIVRNEKTENLEGNRMACDDLNADGYQDILIYASKRDKLPVIYLNDGTGAFDRIKESVLPSPLGTMGLQNYILEDVDGDGIRDLVYFPIVGDQGQELRVRIHKGLRQMKRSDVM